MDSTPGSRLAGRIALVTGGASGFGEGIVRRFVQEGAAVAIVDRNIDKAQALAHELGPSACALHADVSSLDSVEALRASIFERYPRLDILVNNAGIGHKPAPLEEIDPATF